MTNEERNKRIQELQEKVRDLKSGRLNSFDEGTSLLKRDLSKGSAFEKELLKKMRNLVSEIGQSKDFDISRSRVWVNDLTGNAFVSDTSYKPYSTRVGYSSGLVGDDSVLNSQGHCIGRIDGNKHFRTNHF